MNEIHPIFLSQWYAGASTRRVLDNVSESERFLLYLSGCTLMTVEEVNPRLVPCVTGLCCSVITILRGTPYLLDNVGETSAGDSSICTELSLLENELRSHPPKDADSPRHQSADVSKLIKRTGTLQLNRS